MGMRKLRKNYIQHMRETIIITALIITLGGCVWLNIDLYQESEEETRRAKRAAVWTYLQLLDEREQKGYIHQAAIELNGIVDICRSCQRKKLKNQEYLELITKIK
jgi:hypothetical protein